MTYKIEIHGRDGYLIPCISNFVKQYNAGTKTSYTLFDRLKEYHCLTIGVYLIEFDTEEDFLVFKLKFS